MGETEKKTSSDEQAGDKHDDRSEGTEVVSERSVRMSDSAVDLAVKRDNDNDDAVNEEESYETLEAKPSEDAHSDSVHRVPHVDDDHISEYPELPLPSSEKESEHDEDIPTPPDGGWGWVVVFASFMIHIIADGVVYSFGIFYIEFLDYFKSGRGETSWVGSLVPGICLASGPIASILTNKYGCRVVTILGAVTASVGFIISLFAEQIFFLYFSFGIIGGLGFGLIYLPAIVSVGFYFEKKRAFATGLAVCGSGVGTFIFAPLSKWLLDLYNWQGAILIQAALILNCVVCGALFRPLHVDKKKKTAEKSDGAQGNGINEKAVINEKPLNGATSFLSFEERMHSDGPLKKNVSHSIHCLPDSSNQIDHDNLRRHDSDLLVDSVRHRQKHAAQKHQHVGPMARKDIFYSGSLMNIPMYRSNPQLYAQSITSLNKTRPNKEENSSGWCTCSDEVKDSCKEMMDITLLKDPVFMIFAISNLCTSIGFNVPFIYMPDRAIMWGIDEKRAAFLVSVIGISNTVGRVVFGFLSDKSWVNRLWLYNMALTLCGIATVMSSLCTIYSLMVVYAAAFGLFIGAYVSLTSVILVDLLGLEKLTSSFGLLLLFQGLATLIGPPIAGWVYDGTGSYDISFYIAGGMIAISGVMLFFIPCIRKLQKQNPDLVIDQQDINMGKKVRNSKYSEVSQQESVV